MTGSERVLARLRQGPATASELYAETRCMVHSRVADLRRRGYDITCDKTRDYLYRLNEPDGAAQARGDLMPSAGTAGTPSSDGSPLGSRSLHVSGSLSLFDLPRGAYEEVA